MKETHSERPGYRRRIQEKSINYRIDNVCKAVADPAPDHKAHSTRDAGPKGREKPEEHAFVEPERRAARPDSGSGHGICRTSPVPNS